MRIREMVLAAGTAAAVRAAARLGVADALRETPADAADLAREVDADPARLDRLLRALAARGVFTRLPDGRYAHNATSRLLRANDPDSLRDIALWSTEPWTWALWPHLEQAVRTGEPVAPELFGKNFFTYLHDDAPESARVFDRAMSRSSAQSARALVETLDLTGISHIADIGGGQGRTLAALLEANPGVRGTLLDLPAVVAQPDQRLRRGGSLVDRVHLVAVDCRAEIPVEADLYLLKNILEWDEDSTARTLANILAVAPPGARVVVVENLVDDGAVLEFTTAMDLLLMLNVGGRKHTEAGLVALIRRGGLEVERVRPLTPALHMIEARVPR
jgi:SAM-dependent methyltransferase